jgi:hypothetical protein
VSREDKTRKKDFMTELASSMAMNGAPVAVCSTEGVFFHDLLNGKLVRQKRKRNCHSPIRRRRTEHRCGNAVGGEKAKAKEVFINNLYEI